MTTKTNTRSKSRNNVVRKSLTLTPAQWLALQRLAEATHSVAERGPSIGKFSWRALMRRLAEGEVKTE